MSVVRTQIEVAKCDACPFFERTVINPLVEWLAKTTTRSGACRYNGMGMTFPMGRMHIPDADRIPDNCPLKLGDCVIRLGART